MEDELLNDLTEEDDDKPFKVLVCIDGTEESYRGLRYAVRLGSGVDTDLTLLNVRKADKELHTDGLDMSMVRENMLDWGLELPGMNYLKRGLDMLMEMGYLDGGWSTKTSHIDTKGDPLGNNHVDYINSEGRKVTLKLMVAPSAEIGILDEDESGEYDLTILSASDEEIESDKGMLFGGSVSQRIATESHNTVIIAKGLEESQGHLICLSGSTHALNAAHNDALLASRCDCPIFLYTVAKSEKHIAKAQAIIDEARRIIEEAGYRVEGEKIGVGDTVECIIEEGCNYSLIVLSGEHGTGMKRFFKSSITTQIIEGARSSVMLSR